MSKVDDFLLSGGWSENTSDRYRRAVLLFESSHPDPQIVTAEEFSKWLNSFGWSSSTKWVNYTAVRLYIRYLFGTNHPLLSFKLKRKQSPPQRVLTLKQVKSLLSIFDTSCSKGRRDLAIASLFLDSGLRCSEMCNAEISKVHLEQNYIDVLIKGGSWDRAIFSPYTRSCLVSWLSDRPRIADPRCKYIFVGVGGNTRGQKLTRNGLQKIVYYWGQSIGIQLSPHDFRRSMATIATAAGAPSRLTQVAGRWSDISMVEHYTRSINPDAFLPYFPVSIAMNE